MGVVTIHIICSLLMRKSCWNQSQKPLSIEKWNSHTLTKHFNDQIVLRVRENSHTTNLTTNSLINYHHKIYKLQTAYTHISFSHNLSHISSHTHSQTLVGKPPRGLQSLSSLLSLIPQYKHTHTYRIHNTLSATQFSQPWTFPLE